MDLVKGKGVSSDMIQGYIELAGRIRPVGTEPFESKWNRAANAFSCFMHLSVFLLSLFEPIVLSVLETEFRKILK